MNFMSESSFKNDHIDSSPKVNQCALKIIGLDRSTTSDEEVLEVLANYITPSSITALIYDFHNNFFIVFLADIDSACQIINKKITLNSQKMDIIPLLDYYTINNVYPTVSNEEVGDIFRTFGNVYEVKNYFVSPNSSKFSHVLSGKREVSFLLPGKEREVSLPLNVVSLPYTFHVKKSCCACLSEGHSFLNCPDVEDRPLVPDKVHSSNIHDSFDVDAEESNSYEDMHSFKQEDAKCPTVECKFESD